MSAQHAQHTGAFPGTSSQQRQDANHQPVQSVLQRGKRAAGVGASVKHGARQARHKGAPRGRSKKTAGARHTDSQHRSVGVTTGPADASEAQHVQPNTAQLQPELSSADEESSSSAER